MTPTDSRDQRLDALLAAAGASADPEEHDEAALDVVLAAFRAAGTAELAEGSGQDTGPPTQSMRIWPVRRSVRLTAWSAAAVFAVAGTGAGAAAAGILPAPIQDFAHHLLGGIGIPGPTTTGGAATPGDRISASASAIPPQTSATASASGGASAVPGPGASPTVPTAPTSAASSAGSSAQGAQTPTLLSLCGEVVDHGNSWKHDLSAQDLALLTAAAGGDENQIAPYCAQLLEPSSQKGPDKPSATPAPPHKTAPPHPPPKPSPSPGSDKTKEPGNTSHVPANSAHPEPSRPGQQAAS